MSTSTPRNQPEFVEGSPAETWRNIFLDKSVPTTLKSTISTTVPSEQPKFVDNVPAEIWIKIFLYTRTVPTKHTLQAQRGLSRLRRNLFSLSQICNWLRAIVVNSPCLWTWIFVDFTSDSHTPAQNLYLTRLALQRSRDYPLSIWLHNIHEGNERYGAGIECLYVVMNQMARWKNVFLGWTASVFTTRSWSVGIIHLIKPAPLLESLVMHGMTDKYTRGNRHNLLPAKIWAASPRLQRLEIRKEVVQYSGWLSAGDVPISSWVTTDEIPFDRLTHLRISSLPVGIITYDQLVSIFRSSANLVSCFLQCFAVHNPGLPAHGVNSPSRVPFPLRHLRHLYLISAECPHFLDHVFLDKVLDDITAPSLVTLTLDGENSRDNPTYRDFIARSSCPLEELNYVGTRPLETHDAVALMELTPSLRAIHFHDLKMDEVFVKMWNGWDGVEGRYAVCPNLERLSVTAATLLPFNIKPSTTTTPTSAPTTAATLETHQTPGLTEILRSRLLPPNGGSNMFLTLHFPVAVKGWGLFKEIKALCDEPTGLKIGFNDDLLESDKFWEGYGDR